MSTSNRLVTVLARAGYAARGLVYVIIGIMAVLAAFGIGQQHDDRAAVRSLLDQPLGVALLCSLVAGLAGYVTWQVVQAVVDPDDYGRTLKGIVVRIGFFASALSYGALAVFALSLLGVISIGNEGESTRAVADVLVGFFGQQAVTLTIALIFLGVGIAHVYEAVAGRYTRYFNATGRALLAVRGTALVGLFARGLIFGVIAVLLFKRFLNAESATEAQPGTAEALAYVQTLPFGEVWLLALGLGLLAFAAFSFSQAIWRRIDVD